MPAPAITKGGDPEDAADNAESPDFFKNKSAVEEKNAASLSAAAATGESGIFQPAGQSAVKQIIPEPDPTTGALIYSYPLTVPPGRNGMTPDLTLTYNSQDSKKGSYLGDRWSLNIPYIERLNKTGTDRLYTDNFFTSSLGGELVPVSGAIYAPKVENGDFLKYRYDGTSWTVTDKRGTVYKFGAQASTRQDDPSDAAKVYRWMLEEVRDTNGNFIAYAYYKDSGQIYPDAVTYTGNGTMNGIFTVNFVRTSWSTNPVSYATGFPVWSNYVISEIRTEVSGTWARKYALTFATGGNGYGSLLDTITESGQDDLGAVTTLPAVNFDYQTATASWSYNSAWNPPLWFTEASGADSGLRVGDINGDGLPDLMCHNPITTSNLCGNAFPQIYLNNGNGWTDVSATWSFPVRADNANAKETFLDTNLRDRGLRLLDVNGDGLADLVRGYYGADYVYLNNGSGWTYTSSFTFPTWFANTNGADSGLRMGDINGDGLPDIVCHNDVLTSNICNRDNPQVYLNNGSGWTEVSGTWLLPPKVDVPSWRETFLDSKLLDRGLRLLDVNGDGLADLVRGYSGAYYTYINNGSGWNNGYQAYSIKFVTSAGVDSGARIGDVDGDSLPDALCHSDYTGSTYCNQANPFIWLNGGSTWNDAISTWIFPQMADAPSKKEAFLDGNLRDRGLRVIDVNGDGLDDLIRGFYDKAYGYLNNGTSPANLLTKITYAQGGNIAITYRSTPTFKDDSGNRLNPKLPLVIQAVERITATDPVMGISGTSTWSYKDGSYYYSSPTNRRFAGFGTITKTDPAGNVTKTYYHQGNASSASQGEYNDDPAKISKAYRVELYDGAGNLYAATVNKWDKYNLGTNRDFVKLARSTTLTYDGNGTHKDKAAEYAYDNACGNLTQKTDWGEVAANADGSFTDTGADKSTENISYVTNTSSYVVGLPYQGTVTDQGGSKVRETKTYYDALALASVGAGNPTKTEQWVTGSNYITSQKAYNTTYGLMTSETDPRGKVTSYSYDSYNLYPATVTDPLTHTAQYLYDYSSGKAKQVTDQNGFVYQTAYDGLDRVKEEKVPDSSPPYSPVTRTAYTYTDTVNAFKVQRSDFLDAATAADTYQYFDGFGRLIQLRKEAEAAGSFNVKDTAYNVLGLVQKQSLPYAGSGSAKTSPTSTNSLYAAYVYDALGRPLTVTDTLGTTTYVYDDWKTTVTDKNGKVKRYYKDAYGNLAKVDEVNGGSTYITNYEWNLNGRLTKITDALGNIRNFIYDGLGRRISAEDLHAPGDASYGTWTYAYDDAGNVIQTLSPRALTTNYAYNDVNQVLTEDYAGGAGIEISYTYGGCTNGTGKLCAVAMLSGADAAYAYDANGKIASETKTINGTTYATSYAYDRQGNTLTLTYPDSAQVRYTFNSAGLLNQVEAKESGGAFANVVSNIDYSPLDQPATVAYANGITTTNTYDPAKLYRLTHILTAAPGAGGGGASATTSTFYPDPGTGGPTGSATVERSTAPISGETWSALRAGAGTYVSPIADNPNNLAGTQSGTAINQWRALDRAVFTFDTSAIPDADAIVSATLSIYGSAKSDGGTAIAPDINIYDATPASNYNFAAGNYGQIGTTAQATAIPYAGWSTTGYNDFILNAAGLGNISKSGITRFGTRNANYDVANVAPAWSANTGHFITGYLAQGAGTNKDPKLAVVHAPAPAPDPTMQDLNYTYDNMGNITQIIDASTTSAAKTVTYTYDDLHRLVSAVATSTANGANYTQAYAYDALGNIISGPLGSYFYQGSNGSNWANPHAVTSIAGTAYIYDKDGNLTGNGTLANTWNYKGQLILIATPSSTSSYYYDHDGNRVWVGLGSTNTYYPNRYYNTDGAKKTKQVYAGSQLVATTETVGSTVTTYYVHADHLGSTNAVSDSASNLAQTLDYYPFGVQRISSGTYNEQRQYIGQIYDAATGLDYLNARYYEGVRGQFLSQDPIFWENQNNQNLTNPQSLNSYSYADGNPITSKDPNGKAAGGIGINFGGGVPGIYGQESVYAVLTISRNPFNVEVGIVSSAEGGGSTAIGSFEGTAVFMLSPNAKSVSDLEGVDVGGGPSLRIFPTEVGVDMKTSKPNNDGRRITTMTLTAGAGGVLTPYVLPVEVHGGASYTKALGSVNVTQAVKNAYNAVQANVRSVYTSFQKQLNEIKLQINALKALINQRSPTRNSK